MKKIRILPILLTLCLLFGVTAPAARAAADPPTLDAQAVVLVDLRSGHILYEQNKDEQRAPASLTKIMTVLLALEAIQDGKCDMDDMVTAQEDCREGLGEDSSTAGISPGDVLSMRDLIYCSMISSANEACNIIATYLEGSVGAFVDKMNQRAKELGCENTHFVNTNGLPAEGHYSSAYDMFLITREAMSHPDFIEIADTVSYQPESGRLNNGEPIGNSNALINPSSDYGGSRYLYEFASGIKTGYTRAAGYCLISTAEKDGVRVLAVVMGCNGWLNAGIEEYRNFSDTINLYNWVFDNYSYHTVISSSEVQKSVKVDLAEGGEVELHAQQDVTVLLPNDVDVDEIETEVTVFEDRLVAPLAAGTVLGEVQVLVNGVNYGTVRLINSSEVELARGEYMRQQMKQFFSKGWVITLLVIILILAACYIALITRYRKLRREHLRQRKLAEARRRAAQREREAEQAAIEAFDVDWNPSDGRAEAEPTETPEAPEAPAEPEAPAVPEENEE